MIKENMCCLLFFVYLSVLLQIENVNGMQTKDYCEWESFNPQCNNDEVVIVKKAIFGIMEIGTCIEKDYGFLGCSSDQLAYVDGKCSGRRSCNVVVSSKEIKSKMTCPDHYLRASYVCQKVYDIKQEKCYQPVQIDVKYTISYLASIVTKDKTCGSGNTPWVLQAQSGQMINLTLVDFSWGDENVGQNGNCKRQYGHIVRYDNNDVINICGGVQREKSLGLITSHQLQVVLQKSAVQSYNFLIRYQAMGCPDIVPPKNSWMRKEGNDVTIGCHSSSDTWKLKCVGNHWIGVVGNCSIVERTVMPVEKESFGKHHVLAFAVGCLALIICCVTITFGGYFIKRYKIKMKSSDTYLFHSKHNTMTMRTLSHPRTTVPNTGQEESVTQSLVHPELQGIHMCGPNCNCTINNRDQQKQKEYTDDSVLYYVLEQPPIYANSGENANA